MTTVLTGPAHDTAATALDDLSAAWQRHLRAQRASPATIATYGTSVAQFAAYLREQGMPTSPAVITREHVEAFVTRLLERWKPATAHNRYRALRSFFGWLVEEGEIVVFIVPVLVVMRDSQPFVAAFHPVLAALALGLSLMVARNSIVALREPLPAPAPSRPA